MYDSLADFSSDSWGNPFDLEQLLTAGKILRYMECTLQVRIMHQVSVHTENTPQGLAFLHANRTAHRVSHSNFPFLLVSNACQLGCVRAQHGRELLSTRQGYPTSVGGSDR